MELKNYYAQDVNGNIVPGATCYLYLPGTTTLATGLQGPTGAPLTNPFNADSFGLVQFAAPNGTYDFRCVAGLQDSTIPIQFADPSAIYPLITQAQDAATAAAASAALAAADVAPYLGPKSTAPTVRNDGTALQVGDVYFNTASQVEYIYASSGWIPRQQDIINLAIAATMATTDYVAVLQSDLTTRRVPENYFSAVVNVTQFGAKGDGTTNDLAACQAAVNFVTNSNGGIVQFPRGNFVVDGLKVPGNVYLLGAGVSATFLSFQGGSGIDGLEFTYKSTSYNWGGFGFLTIYNAGSFGNRGVFTPVDANAFTKSQRWCFNDFAIRGVSGWANNLAVGDCASARIGSFLIQGPYVAQNPDSGQPVDVGILLKGAQGVVNAVISDAYKIRGVRTGIQVSDFSEGFGVHDGEIVGSYDGIVCDSNPSKPGGFIHNNHTNCSHRGIILNRRRHITINGNQYYRDASYIPNHTLGWKAIEILNSGGVTTGIVQTRPGVGFTDGNVGVSVTDSPDVKILSISGAETGTLNTALQVTASAANLCNGVSLDGISADGLPVWVEFNGAVGRFKLGNNVNERGTAATSPIVFNGSGADKTTIKLPKTSTAIPEFFITANRNAAVSKDVVVRAHAPFIKESLVAGAGAYAVSYYFSAVGAVLGDQFTFRLTQIGGSNSTLNLYTGAQASSPTLLLTLAAAAAGTNQFRVYTIIFNGTNWEVDGNVSSLT